MGTAAIWYSTYRGFQVMAALLSRMLFTVLKAQRVPFGPWLSVRAWPQRLADLYDVSVWFFGIEVTDVAAFQASAPRFNHQALKCRGPIKLRVRVQKDLAAHAALVPAQTDSDHGRSVHLDWEVSRNGDFLGQLRTFCSNRRVKKVHLAQSQLPVLTAPLHLPQVLELSLDLSVSWANSEQVAAFAESIQVPLLRVLSWSGNGSRFNLEGFLQNLGAPGITELNLHLSGSIRSTESTLVQGLAMLRPTLRRLRLNTFERPQSLMAELAVLRGLGVIIAVESPF